MLEKWAMILVGVAFLLGGHTLYRLGVRAMGGYLGAPGGDGILADCRHLCLDRAHEPQRGDGGFGDLGGGARCDRSAFGGPVLYDADLFRHVLRRDVYRLRQDALDMGCNCSNSSRNTAAFQWLYGYIGDAAPALVVLVISLLLLLLHRYIIVIATSVMGAYIVSVRTFPFLFPALLVVGLFSQLAGGRRYLFDKRSDNEE